MAGFNWTCPYCRQPQVVSGDNYDNEAHSINVGENARGDGLGFWVRSIACQNKHCKQVTIDFALCGDGKYSNGWKNGGIIQRWGLWPESSAKPQPEFIPKPLRDNYVEACRIRDLSPKASATLSRRCLQGMIRDFAKIAKDTLNAEIVALQKMVDEDKAPRGVTPESVEAIDHVRKIGNIGAHMEKDIDLIIEIDPDEAQILIELVETLFDEWYVAREQRTQRFKGLAELRAKKDAEKSTKPAQ